MTEEDKQKQFTGYDITCGRFGYLRGAYNGHVGYDAINLLFEGINWEKDWKVDIKLLKANLEELKRTLFITKVKDFHGGKDGAEQKSYTDFVELAEKLVKEGKKPKVHFSY